jgi:hypothetical protein
VGGEKEGTEMRMIRASGEEEQRSVLRYLEEEAVSVGTVCEE